MADRRVAERVRALDAKAQEQLSELGPTTPRPAVVQRAVSDAVERFLKNRGRIDAEGKYCGDLEYSSWRKYRNTLRRFAAFCDAHRISALADVTLDAHEDFRGSRGIAKVTWNVERQTLRTFFGYCVSHAWVTTNPAKELKAPHNLKPNEVVPYTLQEESQILAACDQIGGDRYVRSLATYERLRAKAMVMTLRHTALRVSDVCTLRKDAISWDPEHATWRVFLRTQKSGEAVYLPIPDSLKLALDVLPLPRNAPQDCPYYFWNGQSSKRAVVGIAERTLFTVFKKSGVKDAHAHRFRHTLATRLLGKGATFDEVADILGNTAPTVRKHYGKWSKGRQDNIDRLMLDHFQTLPTAHPVTPKSHEKTEAVN